MLFNDRADAGRELALHLQQYKQAKESVVVGLARGGVVTAYEVAHALGLPLQVIVVRKIGAPNNEELALGAITEKGEAVYNDHLLAILGISSDYIKREAEREKRAAQTRSQLYRGSAAPLDVENKRVILVDDGIATGATVLAAIKSIRANHPQSITLAAPVAAPDSLKKIKKEVEEVVVLFSPVFFGAVAAFYRHFDQTSDEEVIHLLQSTRQN